MKEVDPGKKDTASSLFKKAPNIKDVEIKLRLEVLKRDNIDGNNNLPPLTFPLYQPPPPPPLSLPQSPSSFFYHLHNNQQIFNCHLHLQHFFNLRKIIQNNRKILLNNQKYERQQNLVSLKLEKENKKLLKKISKMK